MWYYSKRVPSEKDTFHFKVEIFEGAPCSSILALKAATCICNEGYREKNVLIKLMAQHEKVPFWHDSMRTDILLQDFSIVQHMSKFA